MDQAKRDLKKTNRQSKKARGDSSKARDYLWKHVLKNNSFGYKFQQQPPIDGLIPDFYCAKLHLAIEVDGTDYDTQRIKSLKKAGMTVLKYSSRDIFEFSHVVEVDIEKVIEKIENEG